MTRGAGVGLRAPHYREVLETRPAIAWVEVHSENFFFDGGASLELLEEVRAAYSLSLHGVGLSLGSAEGVSPEHLRRLRRLVERAQPSLVSEHLCWSAAGGRVYNDLLPLPFTREAIDTVSGNVDAVQQALGRSILVENISSYLELPGAEMPEWAFVAGVVERSGCGLLLDVNNIYVSAANNGLDAEAYLEGVPAAAVMEIHLAGFTERDGLLIDSHSARVAEGVWALYRRALERFGPVPTLIEWDSEIPPFATLAAEARRAQTMLDDVHALAA